MSSQPPALGAPQARHLAVPRHQTTDHHSQASQRDGDLPSLPDGPTTNRTLQFRAELSSVPQIGPIEGIDCTPAVEIRPVPIDGADA
jgi:hypothetical protein